MVLRLNKENAKLAEELMRLTGKSLIEVLRDSLNNAIEQEKRAARQEQMDGRPPR